MIMKGNQQRWVVCDLWFNFRKYNIKILTFKEVKDIKCKH